MINKKSRDEIKRMRHAGHIVALVHQKMKEIIEPGISTKELDDVAFHIIKENKAIPTFLGYSGFPASICASINEQVVHGIPNENIKVKEGDIISIDVGATYAAWLAMAPGLIRLVKFQLKFKDFLQQLKKHFLPA